MLNFIKSQNPNLINKLQTYLNRGRSLTFSNLTDFMRLFLLAVSCELTDKKIVFVANDEQTCQKYKHDLKNFFDIQSVVLESQSINAYEKINQNAYEYAIQVGVLRNLDKNKIVLTTPKALLERYCDPAFYKDNLLKVKLNDDLDFRELADRLVKLGYKRVTMVSDVGEFSIRGDIADIFSLEKSPVRVEFFGDTVTDIRFFDNETQKSFKKAEFVEILPLYKFILDEVAKKHFKKEIPNKALHEQLDNEGYFEGIEYFQNVFNPNLQNFLDLIGNDSILLLNESKEIESKLELMDESFKKQYEENLVALDNEELKTLNHFAKKDIDKVLDSHQKIKLDNFIDFYSDETIELENSLLQTFSSNVSDICRFVKEKIQAGYKVIVATNYKSRVTKIFDEEEISYSDRLEILADVYFTENLSLNGLVSEDFKLVILSDRELFNKHSKDITTKKKSYYKEKLDYIESINDIKIDDYVVHSVHGVGIYKGLNKQELDGQVKDYLTIEYANKDKLYMPAEQINFLCRYRGSGSVQPKISKMGGNDWNIRKGKVKKAVEDVAQELLALYAKRKVEQGYEFEPDTIWQYEMEEAFEYVPTPDQSEAVNDTKMDMESSKPMDRLICGDVGFGKTEVAIRGIFKAVMSSKQVALIVPTTILAMQHYKTISERFKPYPISVEVLSRFRSTKEQKTTVNRLKTGECDVVIATHRLLQDDIAFKNLGFLVIDEEHRFGVRHKEKLKMLKKNIDILSMSATPIPRTLYMSLSGIKDMSVINTPPVNRLPIKTVVGEYSETMVQKAIMHELNREGQVFFLYNRVETIDLFASELKKLVPYAKIKVAHAQMDEKVLEQTILEFSQKEIDVLVCTTIIESGIDIENANTIIINDADRFGLAQLYQLRGRVGRSDRQAYCYCLCKKHKELTQEAKARLNAIKDFTTLGSGYQIALRDIEIRGIGNILGTKQHGHMVDVGFDTYCQLLEEAISEQKGETVNRRPPAIVDININAFIPDDWIGSKEQKMIEYKRLADVKTIDELEATVSHWKDRFSKIPVTVLNLIELIRIRILATNANISVVRETAENIRIYTPFTESEYKLIRAKLSTNITKHIKFVQAPKSCLEGNSILLLNTLGLSVKETFNIMTDLFYYIHKIIVEFDNKIN